MRLPLKMHRTTAVFAAVLMILSQAMNTAASLSISNTYDTSYFLIKLLCNILITVMLSIILFRGRKDTFAGVVFLLAVIEPLLSVAYYFLVMLLVTESILISILYWLSGLATAAFMGLSAIECLTEGNISVGNGRAFLWLLPIMCFFFELARQMLLGMSNGMNTSEMVTSGLVYVIPQWLGPILMGVSLSVPERIEKY